MSIQIEDLQILITQEHNIWAKRKAVEGERGPEVAVGGQTEEKIEDGAGDEGVRAVEYGNYVYLEDIA